MKYQKGKKFYELTNTIHIQMINFEFMRKRCMKLGRVECQLLHLLLRELRPTNLKEAAKRLNVSYSRITHLMDNLIKKGYVRRVPCDIDKRVIYAEITKAGEEIAALYKEDNIKMFIDFLKKMPDVQIEPIYKALNHWCEFLQKANTMLKNTND